MSVKANDYACYGTWVCIFLILVMKHVMLLIKLRVFVTPVMVKYMIFSLFWILHAQMALLALKSIVVYYVLQFFAALAAWLDPLHFNVFVIAFLIFWDVLGHLVSCSKFSHTVLTSKIFILDFSMVCCNFWRIFSWFVFGRWLVF